MLPVTSNYPEVFSQVAELQALTGSLAATSATANATAAALTPPGNDAASLRATTQMGANTAPFTAALADGIVKQYERAGVTTIQMGVNQAVETAGAVSMLAV